MTPDLSRPRATPPYDILPAVPSFSLTSEDLADGERMGDRFTAIHENLSPGLRWSGAPAGTRSFVVSCFDPDSIITGDVRNIRFGRDNGNHECNKGDSYGKKEYDSQLFAELPALPNHNTTDNQGDRNGVKYNQKINVSYYPAPR